jgi:hypothetical protein
VELDETLNEEFPQEFLVLFVVVLEFLGHLNLGLDE